MKKIKSRIWISGSLNVHHETKTNILASIIPKIGKCNIKFLSLYGQNISFNCFKLLAASVETFNFIDVIVNHDDGTIVPFEKMYEASPKAKEILYMIKDANTITSSTFKELVKISHFAKLGFLSLRNVPETFDLEAFCAYKKQNKITKFYLDFDDMISQTYKNRLESIVDGILAEQTYNYRPPYIQFSRLDSTKSNNLNRIFRSN